jgi:ribosomal protein L40E
MNNQLTLNINFNQESPTLNQLVKDCKENQNHKICMTCNAQATESVIVFSLGHHGEVRSRDINNYCSECLEQRIFPDGGQNKLSICSRCFTDCESHNVIYHHYTKCNRYYVLCESCEYQDIGFHARTNKTQRENMTQRDIEFNELRGKTISNRYRESI